MALPINDKDLGKDSIRLQGSTPQNQGGATGNLSQAPTIQNNPNRTKGSGFTNIQKVIGANEGNKLGQTIGSGIQKAGQQNLNNIGQAKSQFDQESQKNQFDTEENKDLVNKALNDPTQFTNNQGLNQFQHLISGNYQGPQNLQNAQQLQGQAQDVRQLGQALGSSGGRTGLLQRFVGNPQYQQGQQTLDSLLLGQSQDPSLTSSRRQALGVQGQLQNIITGAKALGQENVNKAQQFGQNTQNQLGQTITQQNADLTQQALNAQEQKRMAVEKLSQDLQSGNLTAEEAQQLGIENGQQTFNINPSSFLSVNPLDATAQNIATADQYARLNALRQLGGQFTPMQAQEILQKYSGQEDQAGKFAATNPYQLDKEGFQKVYQQSKQDYDNRYNPASQNLTGAQEVNSLVQQRDAVNRQINDLRSTIDPQRIYVGEDPTIQQINALEQQAKSYQDTINQKYPGATTNGSTRTDWAGTNLTNAQRNFDQILQQLQDAYGTKKFNVS